MNFVLLICFILSIMLLYMGFMNTFWKCPPPRIEYRYVPRSFYEEQLQETDIMSHFSKMFDKPSTWDSYPVGDTEVSP